MTGTDKAKTEALGIKNPQQAGAVYQAGKDNPLAAKTVTLSRYLGRCHRPGEGRRQLLQQRGVGPKKGDDGMDVKLVGSANGRHPGRFDGALMKCQNMKVINKDGDGTAAKGPKEFEVPICVWADYSTVGIVTGVDVALSMAGKGMSQDDAAALTAKLHNDVRTKI